LAANDTEPLIADQSMSISFQSHFHARPARREYLMIPGNRGCRAWPLGMMILILTTSFALAANWKKYRGEFAGDSSDCIDFDSIKTDARGTTRFRRYVIDDNKTCGPPTKYDTIEDIKIFCPDVLTAGLNRDQSTLKFSYYDRTKRAWQEGREPSRQYIRVLQYVCQNHR
jgi:hypothetical protein